MWLPLELKTVQDCVSLLQFDDLVIKLQCILCPALELHDVGHLRVNHGQLSIYILLRHVLCNTRFIVTIKFKPHIHNIIIHVIFSTSMMWLHGMLNFEEFALDSVLHKMQAGKAKRQRKYWTKKVLSTKGKKELLTESSARDILQSSVIKNRQNQTISIIRSKQSFYKDLSQGCYYNKVLNRSTAHDRTTIIYLFSF